VKSPSHQAVPMYRDLDRRGRKWIQRPRGELSAAPARLRLRQAGVKRSDIAAVGVTGVMVGAWLVNGDGAAVRPAVLWDDGRARDWLRRAEEKHPDFLSRVFDRSASVMRLGCTLPVLAWLADHEPQSLARAVAVLTVKDFVRLRLTNTIGWDETGAVVAPGRAVGRDFDLSLLPVFRLSEYRGLFPRVDRSEAIAGAITAEAAALTGLAEGTPVVFGAGDTPASVIGAGAGTPGLARSSERLASTVWWSTSRFSNLAISACSSPSPVVCG
jgi:sugar (pentulose or hexulose) kinase